MNVHGCVQDEREKAALQNSQALSKFLPLFPSLKYSCALLNNGAHSENCDIS
jgi:hypothetical protein